MDYEAKPFRKPGQVTLRDGDADARRAFESRILHRGPNRFAQPEVNRKIA